MDLRQLEVFVSVVDHKSFSAAAEELRLSQPTVSIHIRALEQEFQTRLIRRTTRLFALTDAGAKLYHYAVSILNIQRKALQELSDQNKRELHIGASSVPGQCLLPEIMVNFHKISPDTPFLVTSTDSGDVIQRVLEGALDVGFVGVKTDVACKFVPIASDELIVAVPNTEHYRALLRNKVSLRRLLREPMILRTERSGTMQEIEGFLHRMGISLEELQVVAQINDSELLRFCIVQGLGISILSRRMVEDFIRQERILAVPLGEESLVRHLYMIYREDDYMPDLIKLFVDSVKTSFGTEISASCEDVGE